MLSVTRIISWGNTKANGDLGHLENFDTFDTKGGGGGLVELRMGHL